MMLYQAFGMRSSPSVNLRVPAAERTTPALVAALCGTARFAGAALRAFAFALTRDRIAVFLDFFAFFAFLAMTHLTERRRRLRNFGRLASAACRGREVRHNAAARVAAPFA
jgi:hypothetical protein